ncbi:MAG: helix-turn-helix transcriptional regulator [Gammaproteobacteria bacterium]|nr:helix-turn-helix transcriptional regulator [Gammaproteobacteria bacterium]
MTQTTALISTLKHLLRKSRVTYADIADHLSMSEANVKRLFATQSFALPRLESICQLLQLELSDLFAIYEESRQRITGLSLQQEKELVGDASLLLVAVSVRNHLSFDDIIKNYNISETECIQNLAKLDRLKIIDLLPGNRIKLLIDENFSWLPNGPIEQFFNRQIQDQFLKSRFKEELNCRLFQFGLLGENSSRIMINKLKALSKEFTELHHQDLTLPLDRRYNLGLLMALRPWELEVFRPLIKP